MDIEDYITIMQAARQKKVTREAVNEAIGRGALRCEWVFQRRVVHREDVEKWQPRPYKRKQKQNGKEGE